MKGRTAIALALLAGATGCDWIARPADRAERDEVERRSDRLDGDASRSDDRSSDDRSSDDRSSDARRSGARDGERDRDRDDVDASRGNARERRAIDDILIADRRAGGLRTPAATAAAMRRIELDDAPADFARRYRIHIGAWSDLTAHAAILRAYGQGGTGVQRARDYLREATSGRSATMPVDALERQLAVEYGRIQERIRSTFAAVTAIADDYGVTAPAPPPGATPPPRTPAPPLPPAPPSASDTGPRRPAPTI